MAYCDDMSTHSDRGRRSGGGDIRGGSGPSKQDSWVRQIVEPAVATGLLLSVVTALMYYLGYMRALQVCTYFGVDVSLLGYAVPDLVLRSAEVLFEPIPFVVLALAGAVVAHLGFARWLRGTPPRSARSRAVVPVFAAVSVLLLVAAFDGFGYWYLLPRRPGGRTTAALLAAGAVLAEYTFRLADHQRLREWRQFRRGRGRAARRRPPPALMPLALVRVRRIALGTLTGLALFWLFNNQAVQDGRGLALSIARDVDSRPEAVVYTTHPLQLPPRYGVDVTDLPARAADDWRFRYTGLHELFRADGRWLLLPAGWRRDNDMAVIVLDEDRIAMRVELRP